ncbi:MAG: hypothetical protein KDE35_03180 [Geminicoccaceae bacterium]|nr:hypothetical protein [Geminicoccaceae bacterium]
MRHHHAVRPWAFAALLLAGCTSTEEIVPAVTTSPRAPLAMAVSEVEIEAAAAPVYEGDFKDKRRSERLVEATKEFLERRLLAAGGSGLLRATIVQAKLVERPRETKGGIAGVLTRESESTLDGEVGVRLTVIDGSGLEQVAAEVKIGRNRAVPPGLDVIEHDAFAEEFISDLLRQLDDKLTAAVDEDLASFKAF